MLRALTSSNKADTMELTREDLPAHLMEAVVEGLVTDQKNGIALHTGAVAYGDQAIFVSGVTNAGKSVLTALLVELGFGYLTDELVILDNDPDVAITPFARALTLRDDSLAALPSSGQLTTLPRIEGSGRYLIEVPLAKIKGKIKPALVIFPHYEAGRELAITPISAAAAGLRLLQANLNARNLKAGGLPVASRFAKEIPAIILSYGESSQLEGVLNPLITQILDAKMSAGECRRYLSALTGPVKNIRAPAPSTATAKPLQQTTPHRGDFKLTIGMATYDDFDGVYFTIQSLRLNNPELMKDIEFLVFDNNPTGQCGEALKALDKACATYRYIPYTGHTGTALRDQIFYQASSKFVMCMDCHVLLMPGVLPRLMAYLEDHPDTSDLLQGPLLTEDMSSLRAQFDPVWNKGMFGKWGSDPRAEEIDAEPFDIEMQGLGLFVCRKDVWPGFNPNFRGFGGEEGYIHEKFRQRGDRTLCLPFLRWLHRFPRPMGVPYKTNWEDRIRNYTIGHRELGLDDAAMLTHFEEYIGSKLTQKIRAEIETELSNPFCYFHIIRSINPDSQPEQQAQMEMRFEKLGLLKRVSHLPAIETPENPQIGCALSHRAAIVDAKRRGLKNVSVFEGDVIFHKDILPEMPKIVEEIERQDWEILFLGGSKGGQSFELATGCDALEILTQVATTHAIAYNHTGFDRLLDELPPDYETMAVWIKTHSSIDQFFQNNPFKRHITRPVLAAQNELLEQAGPADATDFII